MSEQKRKISFSMPIEPQAWQRVKRNRFGDAYVPQETSEFELRVALLAKKHRLNPIPSGPLKLTVDFYVTPPKRRVRELPNVRPDLDNYVKALKDGLNLVLWFDDAQVVECHSRKLYDWQTKRPLIDVSVEEL